MPDVSTPDEKTYRTIREFMADLFPAHLEKLEREGRCLHCGQVKPVDPWAKKERSGA